MRKTYFFIFFVLFFVIIFLAYLNAKNIKLPPKVYYPKKDTGNFNANTLPPYGIVINNSQRDNKALLEHELVHWKQYQKEGLLGFYFHYLIENAKHGYDGNKYEIEARKNETDYCKRNYTECVRTGNSVTVFNPNFRT